MPTLHIEHAIVDFATWKAAFDRFEDARVRAGVLAYRVQQPVDDPKFVVIDLDFPSAEAAQRFLGFLRENIWASPQNSPALAGAPQAYVLDVVASSS